MGTTRDPPFLGSSGVLSKVTQPPGPELSHFWAPDIDNDLTGARWSLRQEAAHAHSASGEQVEGPNAVQHGPERRTHSQGEQTESAVQIQCVHPRPEEESPGHEKRECI